MVAKTFILDPPFASVTFQESVALYINQAQRDGFTGQIVLHMREGHVGSVEPRHAPIPVDLLTAHLR